MTKRFLRTYLSIIFLLVVSIGFAVDLPVEYNNDIGNLKYVTPAREQDGGTCWAFATSGCLESACYKATGKAYTFNPLHMLNKNAFKISKEDGGTYYEVLPYLADLYGPVLEKTGKIVGYCETIEDVTDEVESLNALDIQNIKKAIYKNGSCVISLHFDDPYFESDDQLAYYCYDKKDPDHTVLLVGWDDNFSTDNFGTAPKKEGAFLVKNSWGQDAHDNGFFWLSYWDKNLDEGAAYDFVPIEKIPYNNYISYCKAYCNDSYTYHTPEVYGKTIYKLDYDTTIYAIRVLAYENNFKFSAKFYVKSNDKSEFKEEISSKVNHPGYVTLYLKDPIEISKGDEITVVTKYEKNGEVVIPVEGEMDGYTPKVIPKTNYCSWDGKEWEESDNIAIGLLSKK